jgi:hypothetical protein
MRFAGSLLLLRNTGNELPVPPALLRFEFYEIATRYSLLAIEIEIEIEIVSKIDFLKIHRPPKLSSHHDLFVPQSIGHRR